MGPMNDFTSEVRTSRFIVRNHPGKLSDEELKAVVEEAAKRFDMEIQKQRQRRS